MKLFPETSVTKDWPRLVYNTVRQVIAAVKALQVRATALEGVTDWPALDDYADDTAAAAGGVEIGELYRNGSVLMVRVA